MIYTAEHLQKDLHLSADLCVVGTGAGGSPVVWEAVKKGHSVLVLEAGSFWRPKDFSQLEHEMFPRLYHDKAGRTTSDRAIQVHQGKGVGGSTLHNINLCKTIPEVIFKQWKDEQGLQHLSWKTLTGLYEEIRQRLSIAPVAPTLRNDNNKLLEKACHALKYKGGALQHNRVGCAGSGFCELGCPLDAKQNALKMLIARAVREGGTILADTWASRLLCKGRKVHGLEAWVRHPATGKKQARVTIEAKAFCISASATGTPTLLQRSEIPDPYNLVGSRLFLHPGAAIAGVFSQTLESWRGIPQSYECTEFLEFGKDSRKRVWILPAFAHPVGVSSILSEFGADHAAFLKDYPRMASFSAMLHDETCGSVRPKGDFGVSIEYWMNASDREQLRLGLQECTRLMLAAGAIKALVPLAVTHTLTKASEIEPFFRKLKIQQHQLALNAVHPMGSVWMGDKEQKSCVNSQGRYHHLDNLFVADTSLFPSSLGVPPQWTTYALGTHIGRQVTALL